MRLRSTHVVTNEQVGMTLRNCASGIFVHIPAKGIRKAIRAGLIKLDGQVVPSNTILQESQVITLWEPEAAAKPFNYPLDVIYEDEHLLCINKPSGLMVSGNTHRTVQRALASFGNSSSVPDALDIVRPVHRLDTGTSGVLVCARSVSALKHISQQFAERTVEKGYIAIVQGVLSEEGEVHVPVDGKSARTIYRPLKAGRDRCLVHLIPFTGRRHQLRQHLKSVGHPILGDPQYGDRTSASRLMLHAASIELTHPVDARRLELIAPAPEIFTETLRR